MGPGAAAASGFHCAVEVAEQVQFVTDLIALGVARKDYELLGRRDPECSAGIVSFRKPNLDSRALFHRLKDEGIVVAPRGGWVRASPHFYITPQEIDRMLDVLP